MAYSIAAPTTTTFEQPNLATGAIGLAGQLV